MVTRSRIPVVIVCALTIGLLIGGTAPVGAIDDAVNGTSEDLESTTNDSSESLEDAEDELDETTAEATDESEEIVDDTSDEGEATVYETTDDVPHTANETTDALDGLTNDELDDTTQTIDDAVDGTVLLIDGTVQGTRTLLDRTVADTTETVSIVRHILELRAAVDQGVADALPHAILEGDSIHSPNGPTSAESGDVTADDDSEPTGTTVLIYLFGILASATVAVGAAGFVVVHSSASSLALRLRAPQIFSERLGRPWEYFGAVLRYSRYDDSDPLEHEHRRTIYEHILEHPGIYLSELERGNGISLSVIRHHLRVLRAENLIRTKKIRGKRRFYPIGAEDRDLTAALSDPATRRIIEALGDAGSARNDELAERLDRDPSTVSHHLVSLAELDLVMRERDGRVVVNRLSPGVIQHINGTDHDRGATKLAQRGD